MRLTDGSIIIRVHGTPRPQPRQRHWAKQTKKGDIVSGSHDPGTADEWKALIREVAADDVPKSRLVGGISVTAIFMFQRPKSHFGTGRNADRLKPKAPKYHVQRPDRDNCEKALTDTLSKMGFWKDDDQVCAGEIKKDWVIDHPGVWVRIEPLEAQLEAQTKPPVS